MVCTLPINVLPGSAKELEVAADSAKYLSDAVHMHSLTDAAQDHITYLGSTARAAHTAAAGCEQRRQQNSGEGVHLQHCSARHSGDLVLALQHAPFRGPCIALALCWSAAHIAMHCEDIVLSHGLSPANGSGCRGRNATDLRCAGNNLGCPSLFLDRLLMGCAAGYEFWSHAA